MTYEAKYLSVANAIIWLSIMVVSIAIGVCRDWWLIVMPLMGFIAHLLIMLAFREPNCEGKQKYRESAEPVAKPRIALKPVKN